MPSLIANDVQIYYEIQGSGPPLLIVPGALADAGHFARVARLLSDEFTVVTYDRRGNSRSSRPVGWQTTDPDEQADDAAALLAKLSLGPAAVFANSAGAIIALNLLIRHPGAVRGAILHEPPLVSVLRQPEPVQAEIAALVEKGMAAGGPRAAAETFFRWVGDEAWDLLGDDLRERVRTNGETFFGVEIGKFEPYRPDDATLARISVPVLLLVSDRSAPFFAEAAAWLADRLKGDVLRTPGTHVSHVDHPNELVEGIRPALRQWKAKASA